MLFAVAPHASPESSVPRNRNADKSYKLFFLVNPTLHAAAPAALLPQLSGFLWNHEATKGTRKILQSKHDGARICVFRACCLFLCVGLQPRTKLRRTQRETKWREREQQHKRCCWCCRGGELCRKGDIYPRDHGHRRACRWTTQDCDGGPRRPVIPDLHRVWHPQVCCGWCFGAFAVLPYCGPISYDSVDRETPTCFDLHPGCVHWQKVALRIVLVVSS